jgi:farnesyl-diphosphate farnesyltransferase
VIEQALTEKQALPAERVLLQSLPPAFALLESLPEADRVRVRRVVVTLTQGMEMDLTTFPAEDSGRVAALPDAAALDRYTYLVAGCVGEFWTEMLVAHTPALRHWEVKRMGEIGIRFGKALQLTNVLRDVPKDLRIGRCYLPLDELTAAGVRPEELLKDETGPRARPVLANWLKVAMGHFSAAEEYLLAHPRRCMRLRLAVLWPILIGLATLALLSRNAAWLDLKSPSKVTRGWVYRVLGGSLLIGWSNGLLKRWIGQWRERVLHVLS